MPSISLLRTFGDLALPAYIVPVRLSDGGLRVFGDDPADRLVDSMMTSCAGVPFYAPWRCNSARYVDGGLLSSLPLVAAAERGASEIYALDVQVPIGGADGSLGMMELTGQAIGLILAQQLEPERELVDQAGVSLHTVSLDQRDMALWDFAHAEHPIAHGREVAETVLAAESTKKPPGPQPRLEPERAAAECLPSR